MKTVVKKWGNSLAIRIPKVISKELSIQYDTEVEMIAKNGSLILTPRPSYLLKDLLAQVNQENLHEEIDTGDRTGREEW
ncbi:AbrB/MazE/SpoVT family DNA-binding domain-containing protein [Candidatus Fermentibacteria bacterium]|nr:MAG: AbrB/MazE/SpoVT family DNA-binding domain-containing protein [Candidatus Fermentibacteria bacterium]